MSTKGLLVISLDLELYWGMFDKITLTEYGANIAGAHVAVRELLALFTQEQIHATWATVGMLMFDTKKELLESLPASALRPVYPDMSVSSYRHIEDSLIGDNADTDLYHYGPRLVQQIRTTPNQELASHTFSHYYCIDGSENKKEIFAADCEAIQKAALRFNAPIHSIVFPRNQTNESALRICKAHGITAYRGTPDHFLYTGKKESAQTNPLLRILRLIDAYINISGHHTYPISLVQEPILANVIGSRFLRPYSPKLKPFEKMRMRRIKKGMTHAAKRGELFHLWWHPHNFGVNQKENLENLTQLLQHFAMLKEKYGMESVNMQEAAQISKVITAAKSR